MAMPNRSLHIVANSGMYCLPQSGFLANKLSEKQLNRRGYYQSKLVPGLWKHEWKPVQFTLVVDTFGVKYTGKEHAQHLKTHIEREVHCHDRAGRHTKHCHNSWLGLQEKASRSDNVILCNISTESGPTQIEEETVSAFSECKDNIRNRETICIPTVFSPTVEQGRK